MSARGIVHVDPRNHNESRVDLAYDGCDRIAIAAQSMQDAAAQLGGDGVTFGHPLPRQHESRPARFAMELQERADAK